ncbi:MAG: hypothetical protein KDK70_04110 [Myxococcales bacterium]|nr:hypothetical protein [Myxococcales bacterium]
MRDDETSRELDEGIAVGPDARNRAAVIGRIRGVVSRLDWVAKGHSCWYARPLAGGSREQLGYTIMLRLVSLRFLSTMALFGLALGVATGFSAEVEASAVQDADAAPVCQAFGCDYSYTKPDGTTGVHTTACSPACDCPALAGHTLFHARCYLKAANDEVPVEDG